MGTSPELDLALSRPHLVHSGRWVQGRLLHVSLSVYERLKATGNRNTVRVEEEIRQQLMK